MRCAVCNKKLAISSAFECSCSKTVCIKHLMREDHACSKLPEIRHIELTKIVADKVPNRIT